MRFNFFRALCALAAVASLVAFAGCGGSSSSSTDNYKKDAQKVATDFKNAAQAAGAELKTATTLDQRVKGLQALKASVDNAANGFEKLTPPSNVKGDQDTLVSGFRALSGDIDAVTQAVKTNDKAAAQAALPKLQADQAKVLSAVQSLQSKIGK
jgi:hypothetical protein